MGKIKDRLQGNRTAKVLSMLAALVMPMYIPVSVMGGASGPLIALLQMIIPIVPWPLILG